MKARACVGIKPFDLTFCLKIIADHEPMAKLVVLSEGLTGRAYELKAEKTTIGRLDDNSFPVPEGSVSGHHCEVLLRGTDVVIKDLSSTNGTFINGQQVSGESVLKPGQILRLGQVEMRLEADGQAASGKKLPDKTMVIPQGVKLNELDQGTRPVAFEKNSPFAKKTNRGTKLFVAGMVVLGLVIVGIILWAIFGTKNLGGPS